MYIYYAKRKSEKAKRVSYDPLTKVALIDEGFYVIVSNKIYNDMTIKKIEGIEGKKAEILKIRLGRKGLKGLIP